MLRQGSQDTKHATFVALVALVGRVRPTVRALAAISPEGHIGQRVMLAGQRRLWEGGVSRRPYSPCLALPTAMCPGSKSTLLPNVRYIFF